MLQLIDYGHHDNDTPEDILDYLNSKPRTLPCKYLYDAKGSQLFDQICELPEYYPTRTEVGILQDNLADITAALGPECRLVELGSGSSVKTEFLLMGMDRPSVYVPIDISKDHLLQSSIRIQNDFPEIDVTPICADFHCEITLPTPNRPVRKTVIYFPGSTIGNLHPKEATKFMQHLAQLGGENCAVLIGVDLHKESQILEAAYNDSKNITAAFNLNLLDHINRKIGSNFDTSRFEHRAVWNDEKSRIEMHLISKCNQSIMIGTKHIHLNKDEHILSEYSYKYTLNHFADIADAFDVQQTWLDRNRFFSIQYLTRKKSINHHAIDWGPIRKVS